MPVTWPRARHRLDRARGLGRDDAQPREYAPRARPTRRAMTSAPFVWPPRTAGPDWGSMWTTFCELALYGGPPQRGPESALRAPTARRRGSTARCSPRCAAGSGRRPGSTRSRARPGWLAVTCDSPTMAAWMCAAIILENVDARVDDDRLMLPAGPGYTAEGRGEEHHHGRGQDASLLAGARRRRRARLTARALSVPLHAVRGRVRGLAAGSRVVGDASCPTDGAAAERIFTGARDELHRPRGHDAETAVAAATRTTDTRTARARARTHIEMSLT